MTTTRRACPILASLLFIAASGCGVQQENWVEENCDDGLDNDLDGLLDCEEVNCAVAAVCGGTEGPTSSASDLGWSIEELTFNDGAAGGGYFIYNASSDRVVDWSICVSAGPQWEQKLYDPSTSTAAWSDYHAAYTFTGIDIEGPYSNSFRTLRISTNAAEPTMPTQSEVRYLSGLECINCTPMRAIHSGMMVADAGPFSPCEMP